VASGAAVVVAAMNLTEENRGYFTQDVLRKCARGAIFVNVSRGELSPPPILLDLLKEGFLGGVGLDVYDGESQLAVALRQGTSLDDANGTIKAILEMRDREDVIMTPHNAFNTHEAVSRKSKQSVEQLLHLRKHGEFVPEDAAKAFEEGISEHIEAGVRQVARMALDQDKPPDRSDG